MPSVPFIQARHYTPTTGRKIRLLVIHSMELDEQLDTAERCARFFARHDAPRASAHSCVDTDSRVDCVHDQDVAYGAPGANHDGLHLELAGRARQTRAEWFDGYSLQMVRGPAASWVAEKAERHGIPIRPLSVEQVKAGAAGVTTHNTIRIAYGKTDHTDPGVSFIMDQLLEAATAKAGPATPPPTTPQETLMADRICIPSWAWRGSDSRPPLYRLDPIKPNVPGEGNACRVLAFHGAPLNRVDGNAYGIPFTYLHHLAAPPIALAEIEATGVIVVVEDGAAGVIDIAQKPTG